jgi:hypothetical protein
MLDDALRQTGGFRDQSGARLGGCSASSAGTKAGYERQERGRINGITFDAGGLIALDCNSRQVIVLLARATELGVPFLVPAFALAQVIRNPARQARLARLIRQADTDLVPLDGWDATAVGLLLA